MRCAPPLVAASSQFPAFVCAVRASRRRILEKEHALYHVDNWPMGVSMEKKKKVLFLVRKPGLSHSGNMWNPSNTMKSAVNTLIGDIST